MLKNHLLMGRLTRDPELRQHPDRHRRKFRRDRDFRNRDSGERRASTV